MGLVEILQNKRAAGVCDDDAILLLLVGKARTIRFGRLMKQSGIPEGSFGRIYRRLQEKGWISVTEVPSRRRGKCSVCQLTMDGEELVRSLYAATVTPPPAEKDESLLVHFEAPLRSKPVSCRFYLMPG